MIIKQGRLKSYYEYKLDLELCGIDTFEKDDKIRQKYDKYIEDQKQVVIKLPRQYTNKKNKIIIGKNLLELKKKKKRRIGG
jgi:hypothetical protein